MYMYVHVPALYLPALYLSIYLCTCTLCIYLSIYLSFQAMRLTMLSVILENENTNRSVPMVTDRHTHPIDSSGVIKYLHTI